MRVIAAWSAIRRTRLKKRQKLWMEIHALRYETEASLQLNSGPWIPINNSTASVLGMGASFGGIGGEFATLKMTMNLRVDDVQPGTMDADRRCG